jgi:hypothetical protein
MQNSQQQTNEPVEKQCIVPVLITAPVINGMIGGISSVITVYFFKPVWDKITLIWNNKKDVS